MTRPIRNTSSDRPPHAPAAPHQRLAAGHADGSEASSRASGGRTGPRPGWSGGSTRTWLRRAARRVSLALIACLLPIPLIMWLETILVFPRHLIPPGDWQPVGFVYEDAWFTSRDGTRLHGWYFPRAGATLHILYCHGNGEDVAALGEYMDELRTRHSASLFAFDFRGYGRSAGRPAEAGIIEDALAAQQWLARRTGIRVADVVLWGRSIGGAIAVQAAATHGARGLILERTFTSLPAVAAYHYPWLPARWLMRNRFDSLSRIAAYSGPLLQSHGTADEVVPLALGRRLFEAARGAPRQFVAMEGVTHNGPNAEEYYTELSAFVARLRHE